MHSCKLVHSFDVNQSYPIFSHPQNHLVSTKARGLMCERLRKILQMKAFSSRLKHITNSVDLIPKFKLWYLKNGFQKTKSPDQRNRPNEVSAGFIRDEQHFKTTSSSCREASKPTRGLRNTHEQWVQIIEMGENKSSNLLNDSRGLICAS